MRGKIASFSDEDADVRINAGVAGLVRHYTVQPDQRVLTEVDENGNTRIETRTVPDDLQRNVDLPPTKAGGKPKAEENMTDEDRKRAKAYEENESDDEADDAARALRFQPKSVDGPQVSTMVSKPQAKK